MSIKTYSYRERDGTERGVFYMSGFALEEEKNHWLSCQELKELRSDFEKAGNKNFQHEDFLSKLKEETSSFLRSTSSVLMQLEKTKRYCEINENRALDEINSLILEMRNLSEKNFDGEVQELIEDSMHKLKQILAEEKDILRDVAKDQKLVAHKRIPKKVVHLGIVSKSNTIRKIMESQGHNLKTYRSQSELYPLVKRVIIRLIKAGQLSPDERNEAVEKLKSSLNELIEAYGNSFKDGFRLDSNIDYEEFRKISLITEVRAFLDKVIRFYRKKEFQDAMEFFRQKSEQLSEQISEITYWTQLDFQDDRIVHDKTVAVLQKTKPVKTHRMSDHDLKIDVLDREVPCYYLRLYHDVKDEDGEWQKELCTSALISSCPDVIKKIQQINPGNPTEVIPMQVYFPSIEVNEITDNTSLQFIKHIHKKYYGLEPGRRIDIIGTSGDVDKLREHAFYTTYQGFNFRHTGYKYRNINDEFNFIKAEGSYTLKTDDQLRNRENQIGKSPLRIEQDKDLLYIYLGNHLEKKLPTKSGNTEEKLLKKLRKASRRHWVNRGNNLRCFVIGSGNGFSLEENTSSKIVHFGRSNIWIDPPGRGLEILAKERIHPDIISGIILTHLHDDHCAGFASFLRYIEKKEEKMTLITTRELYRQILFKYSHIFENLKDILQPIFISIGKPARIRKFNNDSLDKELKITIKRNFHGVPSYSFKFSYLGKTIAFSGDHTIRRYGYFSAIDAVLTELGMTDFSYQKLFDYDDKVSSSLWAISAALRQRSLQDKEFFYNEFSSVAVQRLVDIGVPMEKIAYLSNHSIMDSYSNALLKWAKEEDFQWYTDCDVVVHEMGISPEHTSPDMILELDRYLRTFSEKAYRFYVEHCSGFLDGFPEHARDSALVNIARKEFMRNNIEILPETKTKEILL